MQQEANASHSHQGVYSGWLLKVKGDGAKAKWIQSSCRRYFSIDFESEIVFYAHSATDKRISLPIIFRDIVCASMATTPPRTPHTPNDTPEAALRKSRSGWTSARQVSGAEFAFVLQTRDRRIQLVSDSEGDAFRWVEMLNAAHHIGQGEGHGEREQMQDTWSGTAPDSPGYGEVGTPIELDSPARSLRSHIAEMKGMPPPASRSSTASPTELRSNTTTNTESRSTTEGSESTEGTSSPTAWSDGEALGHAAEASLVKQALPIGWESAFSDEYQRTYYFNRATEERSWEMPKATVIDQSSPSSSVPKTPSLAVASTPSLVSAAEIAVDAPRRLTWQEATEAAKVGSLSSSGQLKLAAADFGLDESDLEEKEGASVRDSSPDSVTISPRCRAGPPTVSLNGNGGVLPSNKECASELATPSDKALRVVHGSDDDDSDVEVQCEVRDRRIELDMELMKAQQRRAKPHRPASSSPRGGRKDKETRPLASTAPAPISDPPEAEDDEKSARIAADLRLLRKPGRACSAALAAAAPAPLRQRTSQVSETAAHEEQPFFY